MESIERKTENNAVVFNVNLIRATLNEASEFKDCLAEAIADNDKDIIVNLSACEHLDSTFLGVLVSSYKKLKSKNRSLVIIEPIDQSSIFLTLNSIGKIFPLYTSVKVALEDIENKKLIEKEINELSGEKSNVTAEENDNSMMNIPTESIKDEISETELKPEVTFETLNMENSESIQVEENIELKDEGFNLVEHKDPENDFDNPTIFNTQESVSVEENISMDTKEIEDLDSQNDEQESEIEDSPFSENVKWEFGFSS